ncbi:hypothetical protein PIB30_116758 [Stylosanthes scabra]|uniref:CCHC-type domain-containing protein n=1 Tax=Stylosanthes scabra TaxID=79078 RepID=A0ABU6VR93_9FABA|nr:hypothetical protein [Stylosanthes scabra]
MDAYKATYMHFINPIPRQEFWERTLYTKPQAPIVKRKPGPLKKKRRKDANEGPSGNKKPKNDTNLKRQLKEFSCTYCGTKGHTKRSCSHKKADDADVAAAAAANAATSAANVAANVVAPAANATAPQPSEINLTQPTYSQPEITEQVPPSELPHVSRPEKLAPKRITQPIIDPMQGCSSGTASRMQSIWKFVPTPGFKPPRKN